LRSATPLNDEFKSNYAYYGAIACFLFATIQTAYTVAIQPPRASQTAFCLPIKDTAVWAFFVPLFIVALSGICCTVYVLYAFFILKDSMNSMLFNKLKVASLRLVAHSAVFIAYLVTLMVVFQIQTALNSDTEWVPESADAGAPLVLHTPLEKIEIEHDTKCVELKHGNPSFNESVDCPVKHDTLGSWFVFHILIAASGVFIWPIFGTMSDNFVCFNKDNINEISSSVHGSEAKGVSAHIDSYNNAAAIAAYNSSTPANDLAGPPKKSLFGGNRQSNRKTTASVMPFSVEGSSGSGGSMGGGSVGGNESVNNNQSDSVHKTPDNSVLPQADNDSSAPELLNVDEQTRTSTSRDTKQMQAINIDQANTNQNDAGNTSARTTRSEPAPVL
jgi:hypothetical protein